MNGCPCFCRLFHPDDYNICTGNTQDRATIRFGDDDPHPINHFVMTLCLACAEAEANHSGRFHSANERAAG